MATVIENKTRVFYVSAKLVEAINPHKIEITENGQPFVIVGFSTNELWKVREVLDSVKSNKIGEYKIEIDFKLTIWGEDDRQRAVEVVDTRVSGDFIEFTKEELQDISYRNRHIERDGHGQRRD